MAAVTALIPAYHEVTKHSPQSVRRPGRGLDWANKPSPYKEYEPGLETVALARPDRPLPVAALDAVGGRYGPRVGLDGALVGRILNLGAGVIRRMAVSPSQGMEFRTYASAGGLYPVEVYAVAGPLPGVPAGVYHYHPRRRELLRLRAGDHRGSVAAATSNEAAVATAPLTLLLTGIPWRTAWKYGARGFRHLWWDAGTMLANLVALCVAAGLPARVVLGFDDAAIERLLGVGWPGEFPLALLAVGDDAPEPGAPAEGVPDLVLPSRPLSARTVVYPEIEDAARAGRLTAGEVEGWRSRADPQGPPATAPPASPADTSATLEAVIRRRGSARSFDRAPIAREVLDDILGRSTAGVPTDLAPQGSRLVEPFAIANRVDGLDPGAYVYDGGLRLLGAGDFAEVAGFLCLEQWLAHDAAATAFLMVDLNRILGRLGDRGYRAAQLEAGVVAGRMYLAAYAHGLGATGLTFYDDAVTEFFRTPGEVDRACMLVTAVGPSTRRLLPLA